MGAVICEARVCGTEQPVLVAGDLNVEPQVIPFTAKALKFGHLVDLDEAFSMGLGVLPLLPVDLMSAVLLALEGISSWFAQVHWLLVLVVRSWKTGGSDLISLLVPRLGWELGLLSFRLLEPFLLLPLRVGYPDRSRHSLSKSVQGAWQIYFDVLRLVPVDVRVQLHQACHVDLNVDFAWDVWCRAAKSNLLQAEKAAGVPVPRVTFPERQR